MYVPGASRGQTEEGVRSSGTGVTGYEQLNHGPFWEQQVLLTTELLALLLLKQVCFLGGRGIGSQHRVLYSPG